MALVRRVCLWLSIAVFAVAQGTVTVDQLVSFVKTAVHSRQDDKKVAEQVEKLKMRTRIDDKVIEDLHHEGAGPKTLAALQKLAEASASLPSAAHVTNVAPAVFPPPPADDQKAILKEIQEHALNYTNSLPNYICTQVTKRHIDPTGTESWKLADVITETLSYVDHKENYKVVMINNDMVTKDVPREKLGGAKSSGEFASILHTIFDPETQTEFAWERWTTLEGRKNYVFTFRVVQHRYSIMHEGSKRTISVGFHGSVFADEKTKQVMRVTMECDGIPADFPIQSVKLGLYYAMVDISGQEFVLPSQSTVQSREGKYLAKNEVSYHNYHKYSADASISFGGDDTPPPPPTKKK